MARKPKTQPSPDNIVAAPVPEPAAPDEAAAPARRGRKPKTAALSFASPAAAGVGGPATDDAGADASKAGSAKAPGRRGPGRKPKQAAGAEAALSTQDSAAEQRDQMSGQPEAETSSDLTGDDAPAAAAMSRAETAADSGPIQPDHDPASPVSETTPSGSEAGASVPAAPAAHWDQATDKVRLDWPAIERVAAQGGPNQGMAKLLVAARAAGAGSRWPFVGS